MPDYSMIVPQTFEMSPDVTVAGFKAIPGVEEKARKMLARYIKESEEVTEPIEIKPLKPGFHNAEQSESW